MLDRVQGSPVERARASLVQRSHGLPSERAECSLAGNGHTAIHPPDLEALRQLAARVRPPCVSLYLPLEPFPNSARNAVQARQAVETATKRLQELALESGLEGRISEFLAAVRGAVAAQPRAQGTLVALVDAECLRLEPIASRIPMRVAVGRAFVLRPLLRALAGESRYRLLAASAERVALFEGDSRGLELAPLGEIPASLEDALGSALQEKWPRLRGTAAGRGAPADYAHGDAARERRSDAERFHHLLGRAVARRFCCDHTPLVLAADASHQSGLRGVLRVPGLLDEGVVAGPDPLSPMQLHARAWPLVAAAQKRREHEVLERWEHARNRRRSMELVDDVARAVAAGRVRALWIEEDVALPGRIDPSSGAILEPVGDDDVMEHLVLLAMARGCEVHVVGTGELPTATGVAAELH